MSVKIEIKQTAGTAKELEETLIAAGKGVAAFRIDLKAQGFGFPDVVIEISQPNTTLVKQYAIGENGIAVELGFKPGKRLIPFGVPDSESGIQLYKIEEAGQ